MPALGQPSHTGCHVNRIAEDIVVFFKNGAKMKPNAYAAFDVGNFGQACHLVLHIGGGQTAGIGSGQHTHDFVANGLDHPPTILHHYRLQYRKTLINHLFGCGITQGVVQLGATDHIGEEHRQIGGWTCRHRARQTAEAISASTGAPLTLDAGLRERRFGVFEGLTWAEIAERFPSESLRWRQRDLSGQRYVYIWADGVYFRPRMAEEKQCVLVLIGADEWGRKEIIGLADGYRESTQSWRELLLDLQRRGLTHAPDLAVGDGALGFWNALREVFGLRPIHEFDMWLEKMGFSENGKLTPKAGDASVFLKK